MKLILIGKMQMSSNRNILAIIIHQECATFRPFVAGDVFDYLYIIDELKEMQTTIGPNACIICVSFLMSYGNTSTLSR